MLRNKHVTRLGSPVDVGGALYYVKDQEGLYQMAVDVELSDLMRRGIPIIPQLQTRIQDHIKIRQDIYISELEKKGVPESLESLVRITKKSEAKKLLKSLTISEYQLFLFIQNCTQIGYSHKSKFPTYVPEHLEITEDDREKQKDGDYLAVTKKIHPLLAERKNINVHMFSQDETWHCFYYTFHDIETEDDNHWKHGSHLHYISHLWPNYHKKQVWEAFDKRRIDISGDLHVRFHPYDYPKFAPIDGNQLSSPNLFPGAIIYDLALASEPGLIPVPTAQVETRGVFITRVSRRI